MREVCGFCRWWRRHSRGRLAGNAHTACRAPPQGAGGTGVSRSAPREEPPHARTIQAPIRTATPPPAPTATRPPASPLTPTPTPAEPPRASDGQHLGLQPAAVQAAFRATHGDAAEARWAAEHEAELNRPTP